MSEDIAQSGLGTMLLQAGWRQCSLFTPTVQNPCELPGYMEFDPSSDRLMLCTQSCSVCSEDEAREPLVEVMAVVPVGILTPQHKQAQTGALVRELVIRTESDPAIQALTCDAGRRAFIGRRTLLKWSPDQARVVPEDATAFQGWMARLYNRLALPNELGFRLRASGLLDAVRKMLKGKIGPKQVHEGVDRFYVVCKQTAELARDEPYAMDIIIVCTDEGCREHVDRAIQVMPMLQPGGMARHGISMAIPDVKMLDEVTLKDIRGYTRLNDWDALSGMADFAESTRRD